MLIYILVSTRNTLTDERRETEKGRKLIDVEKLWIMLGSRAAKSSPSFRLWQPLYSPSLSYAIIQHLIGGKKDNWRRTRIDKRDGNDDDDDDRFKGENRIERSGCTATDINLLSLPSLHNWKVMMAR